MFSNKSGLFLEAKKAKYLPSVIMVIILGFGFGLVGEIIGEVIVSNLTIFQVTSTSSLISIMSELVFGFLFITLTIFAWVKFIEKRKIVSMGFYKENFIKKYVIGFLLGIGLFTLVVGILAITGHIEIEQNPTTSTGLAALSSILLILPGWMIQSATEEIWVRGWMMNVLGARYNAFLGLVVSSLFFGMLHVINPNVSLIAILNIIVGGVFLGLYMMKTNNLWGICGFHCAWNWIQGNVFGFEVSGQKIDIGSFIKLKLVGSEWFTGGVFGPEAGFVATIVLGLGCIVILFMGKKK